MSSIPIMRASFNKNPNDFVRWVKSAIDPIMELLYDPNATNSKKISAGSNLILISRELCLRVVEKDWDWANKIADAVGDINRLKFVDFSELRLDVNVGLDIMERDADPDLSGLKWLNDKGFNWIRHHFLVTAALCGSDDLREVKWLLSIGCPAEDLNKMNAKKHYVHNEIDLEKVEALWELGLRSKPINCIENKGNLLHRMAQNGCSVEFFRKLIDDAGLSPDDKGNSPLHNCEIPELVAELLAAGCDPNAVNHKNETPYFTVAMRGLDNSRQTVQTIVRVMDLLHNVGGRSSTPIEIGAVDSKGRPIEQSVFGFFEDHVVSDWHTTADLLLIAETFWRHGYRPRENERQSHWKITPMLIERYALEEDAARIRLAFLALEKAAHPLVENASTSSSTPKQAAPSKIHRRIK